jgi:hypothetical protein
MKRGLPRGIEANRGPNMTTIPDDGPKQNPATLRRRLPLGISVRMLMILVLVLGCWLGWYVPRVRVQQAAVAAIKEAGGTVDYDWEWDNSIPDIIDPNGKPRAPRWLAKRIGVDYVANVVGVNLVPRGFTSPNGANDATLEHVGRLRRTELLNLRGTAITDAGLAYLKDLTGLRQLDLAQTQIGDAGLAHLKRLNKLRCIQLGGPRISDDSVLKLEKANPDLYIYRYEEGLEAKTWQRANADLEFARSQPVRLARILLEHRVVSTAQGHDPKEFIATIDALCALDARDTWSLIKKAEALAVCLGPLQPTNAAWIPEPQRQALEQQCINSGVAALTLAVALGYDNVRRLDGTIEHMGTLWNFHDHPAIPRLIAAIKVKQRRR